MHRRAIVPGTLVAMLLSASPVAAAEGPGQPHYASGSHMWFSIKSTLVRAFGGVPTVTQKELDRAAQEGWWGAVISTARAEPTPPITLVNVEGRIQSVDTSSQTVILEDGTQLIVSDAIRIQREALTAGATVKASYREQGGQNVVISIQVTPPARPGQ